ncbi:DUF1822 family protein [Aerosakkonemataceae cyanobacterium BLCC-F50]|uniref:DUF1822 family protein n=1 Tax=Floridaenema flaviceps BLCC-F50 TaxID=3153642 RepID=A0ABV4XIP9_9CYAN
MPEPILHKDSSSTTSTAEYVIGLLLSFSYQLPAAHQSVLSGQWQPDRFAGGKIYGQTLGIIGFGEIASQVATVAQAFGIKVLVYSPSLSNEEAKKLGDRLVNFDSLLRQADYITLHLPPTPENTYLINAEAIAKMKSTACLINCTHSSLVDEFALAKALETGKLAGAAVDVYDTESVRSSPLKNLGNKVILTPHIASHVQETVNTKKWFENIFDAGWQALESLLAEVETALNPPQYELAFRTPQYNLRTRLARVRSRSSEGEQSIANVTAIKLIELDTQPKYPLALVNHIEIEADQKRDILLQVYPIGNEPYLPTGLELIVLDENQEIFLEAKARTTDNWIQLEFRGEPEERFSIKVVLGDGSFSEEFVL